MDVFSLMGTIALDGGDKVNSELSGIEGNAEKAGGGFGKFAKIAGAGALAVGAAAVSAGAGALALANKFAATGDEIAKSAMKMGVGTDALQELRHAGDQVGVSSDSMDRALGRLNQRIGLAAGGNEKYQDSLQKMGFSMAEIEAGTISTEDAFMKSIHTLHEMDNATEQSALASELFGTKLARDLMPAIVAGGDEIEGLRERAHELGIVMSEDALKAAEDYSDAMDELKKMFTAVFQEVATKLIPVFIDLFEWAKTHAPKVQAFFKNAFEYIERAIVDVIIPIIMDLVDYLKGWYNDNREVIDGIVEKFIELTSKIREFWNNVIGLFKGEGGWLLNFTKMLFENIMEAVITILDLMLDFYNLFFSVLTGDWEGAFNSLLSIFTNIGRLILNQIKNVLNMILSVFGTSLGELLNRVVSGFDNVVIAIANFADNALNRAKTAGRNIVNGIINVVNELPGRMFDAGKNIISSLVRGITSMIGNVTDAMSNIAGKIRDFLPFSPAKEGPLKDLNNLDFVGPISDSIKDAERLAEKASLGMTSNIAHTITPQTGASNNRQPSKPVVNINIDGLTVLDDYGVDQFMDRVMERMAMRGATLA